MYYMTICKNNVAKKSRNLIFFGWNHNRISGSCNHFCRFSRSIKKVAKQYWWFSLAPWYIESDPLSVFMGDAATPTLALSQNPFLVFTIHWWLSQWIPSGDEAIQIKFPPIAILLGSSNWNTPGFRIQAICKSLWLGGISEGEVMDLQENVLKYLSCHYYFNFE